MGLFFFRVKNTLFYGKGMNVMNTVMQIFIQVIISLLAAIASVIGTKLATMMWDKYTCNETV